MIFKEDGRVCEMKNGTGFVLASIIKCSYEFKTNGFPFLSLPDIAYIMKWQDEGAQGHPAHSSYFSTRILKKPVTSRPIISFALSNHSSYSIPSQICWHKVILVPDSEKSTLCPQLNFLSFIEGCGTALMAIVFQKLKFSNLK